MLTRLFTALGQACPVIGFGTWAIGGETPGGTSYGAIDGAEASKTVTAAYNSGVRFFDTSPAYGYGQSEKRLSSALRQCTGNEIIATKGGLYDYSEGPDFNTQRLESELTNSLARLERDVVDLFQLHNPPADLLSSRSSVRQWLDTIREKGKARTVGVSPKSPEEALDLLKFYPFDAVQVNFNMLDIRSLTCGLLDYCAEKRIAVIARTPLCFGFLTLKITEKSRFSAADHRAHWPKKQLKLWTDGARDAQEIAARFDTVGTSPVSRALRFCLSHPAVTCVLAGPMSATEAAENAAAGSQPGLQSGCLEAVAALHQDRHFFIPRN